jgi:UDP-glucose 4-epimerase
VKRILVTGSEGFIGRRVVSALRREYEVYTVDILEGTDKHSKVDVSSEDIHGVMEKIRPEVVVHLAAQIVVSESLVNPEIDLQVNGLGTLRTLRSAIANGCDTFINIASGGAIYDSNASIPLTESSHEFPVSPYGLTKSIAEGYVRIFSESAKIKWASLALSNCYGPIDEHGRGVIYNFVKAIQNNKDVQINGPEVTRDFVYIDDVVEAILKAIKNPPNCRINISSGTEISLFALYQLIEKQLGKVSKPQINEPNIGDILRSCLSNKRAKELIDWSPKTPLAEGIRLSLMK